MVGAGNVGATIVYAAMIRGVGKQIALFDVNEAKVRAEVLDHSAVVVSQVPLVGADNPLLSQ